MHANGNQYHSNASDAPEHCTETGSETSNDVGSIANGDSRPIEEQLNDVHAASRIWFDITLDIIRETEKLVPKEQRAQVKTWLDEYHNQTSRLEQLAVRQVALEDLSAA